MTMPTMPTMGTMQTRSPVDQMQMYQQLVQRLGPAAARAIMASMGYSQGGGQSYGGMMGYPEQSAPANPGYTSGAGNTGGY